MGGINQIYTIGYGDKDFEKFISFLKKFGIKRVVDVRSFPKSKWPEFEKENLEDSLPDKGLEYFHLEKLGGYRKGGYEKYMETDDFRAGLSDLEGIAREKGTVVMCLESYPSACHRRYIAKKLKGRGWRVSHLVGEIDEQKTLD